MTKKFVLYEHALGYALIKVKAPTVEDIVDLAKQLLNNDEMFCKSFKLHAFVPFGSSAGALHNCNAISEGLVHEDLKNFLLEKLPSDSHVLLCVAERKLADALKSPETGLSDQVMCSSDSILLEVYRALRLHFPTYIKELSHFAESTAQIGLGHSYSRAKVKFNVNRNDNMIIQSINLLDQLDKDINVFCMRVKEWFSYHFPELVKVAPDNVTFLNVLNIIGTREGATEDKLEALEEVLDSEKAQSVIEAAKASFGFDITEDDAENLSAFTQKILALVQRRKQLQNYLATKLSGVAPNLSTLIGDRVSARLISHAGSLMNLAKFPASTIQILGAEKALFRALRTRGRTPKYGLIYHSPFITRASKPNKGRISRFLAAKCAIACRLDCFSEVLCDIYGKHLKKQIEDRLTYLETGKVAPTNAEAMAIANAEAHKYIHKMKKKAIKVLQKRAAESEVIAYDEVDTSESVTKKKKKKKSQPDEDHEGPIEVEKRNSVVHLVATCEETGNPVSEKKSKKRRRAESAHFKGENGVDAILIDSNSLPKRKRTASESSAMLSAAPDALSLTPKKKKLKREQTPF
ncbi:hypothetical protein P879_01163 [Paragonimus westermani]|uniref:Nucleolar protein 56 n=1 Tax=Paragonimus westermani TaxID=34504 RepID=A0A8T0DN47_9TREM|nr:hypothetical protein P879_01163 [Paragonimus westermani]